MMLKRTAEKMDTTAILAFAVACRGGEDGGGGAGEADGGAGEARTVVAVTTWLGSFQKRPLFAAAQDGDGAWQALDSATGCTRSRWRAGGHGLAYCQRRVS